LFDVGHQEGTDYLVMEYLEGETLHDRLAKGAIPVDKAIEYAIQIASALDNAHRQGIVHRDLKPGNIMVTKTGVKVLDFGLAKTATPAVVGAGFSMLPTTPANLTAQGAILGTFQYMAPEQVEGEEADQRTDIFAVGAIVYEMVTGSRAFEGKSQASLIASILEHEPSPLSVYQPLTPRVFDHIVRKCLAKDRDERWQTARDLHSELKWIADPANRADDASSNVAAGRRKRARLLIAGVLTAAIAATALMSAYWPRTPQDAAPVGFFVAPPDSVVLPPRLTLAASPDGRRVAFIANRAGAPATLWVRSLDALEAQELKGTDGAGTPFWSPDSHAIGFFAGGKLKTIDASGGPVRVLSDEGGGYGGTWNRDGVIVFAPTLSGRLFKVPSAGGQPTSVTTVNASRNENAHRFPAFLPDGRHFLYFASPSNTIWVASLDSNDTTKLVDSDSQAQYVEPGFLMFVRQGTLLAQPFDATHLKLSGNAVPVADHLAADQTARYASFSASDNGVLTFRPGSSSPQTQLTWIGRNGTRLGAVGEPGLYRNPVLSPDGARVALEMTDRQSGTQDIWLMELNRDVLSRFTFHPANDIYPVWSPDSSRIIFGSDRLTGLVFNLYQKVANGGDEETRLVNLNEEMAPYSWSSDGRYIMFRRGLANQRDIGILSLADRSARAFLPPRPNQNGAFVSPDGRWVAYQSVESGQVEVYVRTFPVPSGKWQISQGGAVFPRWRRDSKELYYYASDGRVMAVSIGGTTTLEVGTPVPLFEARMLGGPTTGVNMRGQYATSDGQKFLVNVPIEDAASTPMTVVLNWTSTLKK
jgi:Tol biopolymer transport system component